MRAPAILKGWLENTLACGQTWDFGKIFDGGLLRGKKGMVVTCTSTPEKEYAVGGKHNMTQENRLHHITYGSLRFCGMDALPSYVAYAVVMSEETYRKNLLAELEKRIQNIQFRISLNILALIDQVEVVIKELFTSS